MLLGENWPRIIAWLDIYQNIVLVILAILALAALGWLIYRLIKSSKARKLAADAVPAQDK